MNTAGQILVALAIVWGPAVCLLAWLWLYAARHAEEMPGEYWPADVEDAITEAVTLANGDDFAAWTHENGWASA